MPLTQQLMFDRMMQSDPSYDGRFITGVLTTGIYCLPSCRARKPHAENVRFFGTESDARAAGLRPCKKCKPDAWYAGHDPQWGRLRDAWQRLQDQPADFPDVSALGEAVGIGPSRLHTLVDQAWQVTPANLILKARLQHACFVLHRTDKSMIEVAFQSGFGSLSAFNGQFRDRLGLTPTQYRKLPSTTTFSIALPTDYPAERILQHLARDPESLTEIVQGRQYRMGLWLSGRPVETKVDIGPTCAVVTCPAPELNAELLRHVRGRLGLDLDPGPFERHCRRSHGPLVEEHPGLRIPLLTDPFEALCWIVIGQQVNLRYACVVRRRLVEKYGVPTDGTLLAPPLPARLAALESDALAATIGTTRRKAETLVGLARGWLDDTLPWPADEPLPSLEQRLRNWPGLGPWSVQYLLLRCLGRPDCLPVGDSALHTAAQRYFRLPRRPTPTELTQLMEPFRPWRSLATFHLWKWSQEHRHDA